MKNRVTVTVGGLEYNILADDDPDYVRKTAELVERRLREMKQEGAPSSLTAAVMAALNIADDYYKSQLAAEHLRGQVREYADEAAALRAEVAKPKKLLTTLPA